MKKVLSVLLVAVFLIAPLSFLGGIRASAATLDGLAYTISGGEAQVTGFSGASLADVTIPASVNGCAVTSIADDAFMSDGVISSVTVPGSVKTIGQYAFSSCHQLTDAVLSEGVKEIGLGAFTYCENLAYITLPDSADSIGAGAFCATAYYNDLSNWQGGLLYLGKALITSDYNISGAVSIKAGTLTVASAAFVDRMSVTSVALPEGLRSIGDTTFGDCMAITAITIPNSVIWVGKEAFRFCMALKSITLPAGVRSVGENAFDGTAFYNDASAWKNGLLYLGDVLVAASSEFSGECTVQSGTTCIADGAFSGCQSITSISLPASLCYIGSGAFNGCKALTGISIPANVTSIGSGAFRGCASLLAFTVGGGNSAYMSDGNVLYSKDGTELLAYPEAKSAQTYTVKDGTEIISAGAFCENSKLTALTLPSGVTSIDNGAFSGCKALQEVRLNDGLVTIGEEAFSNCFALTTINLPNSLTEIGDRAFYYCAALTSVSIPAVNRIGESAFNNCRKLLTIELADGIRSIGLDAFVWTASYNAAANWVSKVYYVGDYLIKASNDISGVCTVKSGTKFIANSAFLFCSYLQTVVLPDGLSVIGDRAFRGCSALSGLVIPSSVTEVGQGAFDPKCDGTGLDKMMIFGVKGSFIEHYALDNGIGFTDEKEIPAPVLLSAVNDASAVNLRWNAVAGVQGYFVFRRVSGSDTWIKIGVVSGADNTSFRDKSAAGNTAYQYTVRAFIGPVMGYYSQSGIGAKFIAVPLLVSAANTAKGLELCWKKVAGATGYRIYRRTGSGGWALIASLSGGSLTSFSDLGVKSGVTYTYTVRAVSGSYVSFYNTTGITQKFLSTPAITSAKRTSKGITVNYRAATGASGYIIYRHVSGGSWARVGTVNAKTLTFTDKTAKRGTTYYYTVRAYSGSARSSYYGGVRVK